MSPIAYASIFIASVVGIAHALPPTVPSICYTNPSVLIDEAPETLRAPKREEFTSDYYYSAALKRFTVCGNWAS